MKSWKQIIPALIATLYFVLFGRYGFGNTDEGFITGFAWRVLNGEQIYKQFIYIRPPLTPLLHGLLMKLIPLNYYVLSERAVSCTLVLTYSYIAVAILRQIFSDDDALRDHAWIYTSAFFVFSIHNLSPLFAWHTIDGVFFAVAGAWFLLRRSNHHASSAVIAAVLLMASASAKQSFYVMPLIGVAHLGVVRRKTSDIMSYLATCLALLIGFLFTLKHFGLLTSFRSETTGATHLKDAIQAGGVTYFMQGGQYLGYCFLIVAAVRLLLPVLPTALQGLSILGKRLIVFLSVFLMINLALIARNIEHGSTFFISQGPIGYSQAMFLVAAYFTVEELRVNFQQGASFAVLLMIAWCASMSWGYQTPLFFSAPIIYGVVRLAHRFGDVKLPREQVASLILCFGLVTFAACDIYPYKDLDGRLHDHRSLGKLAPRLSGIVAGDKDYAKLNEFLSFEQKFGNQFVTLPAFPSSHFITGTFSPAPVDWALNAEMASKTDEIFSRLNSDNVYAIVDIQERKEDETSARQYQSDLAAMVEAQWPLVAHGTWYRIYASPKFTQPRRMAHP